MGSVPNGDELAAWGTQGDNLGAAADSSSRSGRSTEHGPPPTPSPATRPVSVPLPAPPLLTSSSVTDVFRPGWGRGLMGKR